MFLRKTSILIANLWLWEALSGSETDRCGNYAVAARHKFKTRITPPTSTDAKSTAKFRPKSRNIFIFTIINATHATFARYPLVCGTSIGFSFLSSFWYFSDLWRVIFSVSTQYLIRLSTPPPSR